MSTKSYISQQFTFSVLLQQSKQKTKLINFLSFQNETLKEEIQLRKLLTTETGFYNHYFQNLKYCFTKEEAFLKTNHTYKLLFGEEKTTLQSFFKSESILTLQILEK